MQLPLVQQPCPSPTYAVPMDPKLSVVGRIYESICCVTHALCAIGMRVCVCFLDVSVFRIVDLKPRMAQLMRMKTSKGEKVEIIKTIAPDWKPVGFLMDLDPRGQKIRCIEAEHAYKLNGPVICCQEIFTLWLDSPVPPGEI